MNETEIAAAAWHEAGHHLAASRYGIPSFPKVTPEAHYTPGSAAAQHGICHIAPATLWESCVVAWGGSLGQVLGGHRFDWMPPFVPTARDLKSWFHMMMFRLEKLSESDQQMIRRCNRPWAACKAAHRILRKDIARLRRVAGHLADDVHAKTAKEKNMNNPPDPKAVNLNTARVLEDYLNHRPTDDPDRPRLTAILSYLKRGEEPPAEIFRTSVADSPVSSAGTYGGETTPHIQGP